MTKGTRGSDWTGHVTSEPPSAPVVSCTPLALCWLHPFLVLPQRQQLMFAARRVGHEAQVPNDRGAPGSLPHIPRHTSLGKNGAVVVPSAFGRRLRVPSRPLPDAPQQQRVVQRQLLRARPRGLSNEFGESLLFASVCMAAKGASAGGSTPDSVCRTCGA